MSKVFQVHVSSFSNVSDWLKQILSQSEAVPRSRFWRCNSMEFLCLFLRHHILGKLVVASWNVGCCLRLVSKEDPLSLLVVRCWVCVLALRGIKRARSFSLHFFVMMETWFTVLLCFPGFLLITSSFKCWKISLQWNQASESFKIKSELMGF